MKLSEVNVSPDIKYVTVLPTKSSPLLQGSCPYLIVIGIAHTIEDIWRQSEATDKEKKLTIKITKYISVQSVTLPNQDTDQYHYVLTEPEMPIFIKIQAREDSDLDSLFDFNDIGYSKARQLLESIIDEEVNIFKTTLRGITYEEAATS